MALSISKALTTPPHSHPHGKWVPEDCPYSIDCSRKALKKTPSRSPAPTV